MTTVARTGHIRLRDWHRVSTGLFRPADGRDLDAWQLALPKDGRFSSLTSAEARGWWMPHGTDGLPVVAAVGPKTTRPQRPGLLVVRCATIEPSVIVDGLQLDSVVDTLLVAARHLAFLDLVVMIDSALHAKACTRDEIERVARMRRKGAQPLRHALAHADARSESAYETLLRLLLRLAGYQVEPQHKVLDEGDDEVARIDLWFVGTRSAAEYDGKDHLPKEAQESDLARVRRLIALGWDRRGYVSKDLIRKAAGVLRDAEQITGRAPRTGALLEWHRLLAESCYTPPGRVALAARLGPGGSGKCSADRDTSKG